MLRRMSSGLSKRKGSAAKAPASSAPPPLATSGSSRGSAGPPSAGAVANDGSLPTGGISHGEGQEPGSDGSAQVTPEKQPHQLDAVSNASAVPAVMADTAKPVEPVEPPSEADVEKLSVEVAQGAVRIALRHLEEAEAEQKRLAKEAEAAELERKRQAELAAAAAAERAAEQLRAAHEERARSIARAKERARQEEDDREARGVALLETALAERLLDDLHDLSAQEEQARSAVRATDQEVQAVEVELGRARSHQGEIDALAEQEASLASTIELLEAYSARCASCQEPIVTAEDAAVNAQAEQEAIAAHAATEAKESKARLSAQVAAQAGAEARLAELEAECDSAEAQALDELKLASSAANAKSLQLALAEAAVRRVDGELSKQAANLVEATKALGEQRERMEATKAVLAAMEAKASQEQARMLEIDESIATLDAAEEHAAACAALVDAAFELDREAATHLCGMHDGVLSGAPLPSPGSPHKRASLKEQATINTAFGAPNASLTDAAFDRSPKGASKPTRQRLLQQTYNLVRERLRLSEACVADVEARMAQHSADCEAARHARQEELLALRSERSAIEQETAEREAFVRQKRAQLKVELDEVRASVMAVHALEECLTMLEGEAQAASARRDKATLASNDADAVREEAVISLDTTRARSKERLKAMRATVAAETDVAKTRMASTDAIMGQLARLDAVAKAGRPLAPGFQWARNGETAPGRAANELISQNNAANTALLSTLRAEAAAVSERLEAKRTSLADTESHASAQLSKLSDQRAKQVAALAEIDAYASNLEAKSPRAAAASPRRSSGGGQHALSSPSVPNVVRALDGELSSSSPAKPAVAAASGSATGAQGARDNSPYQVKTAQFSYLLSAESKVSDQNSDDLKEPSLVV